MEQEFSKHELLYSRLGQATKNDMRKIKDGFRKLFLDE